MGSGKTTVGKIVAAKLKYPFVDLDEAFEKQIGLSPQFYIPRFKEAAFRNIEKWLLRKILFGPPVILATGGGSVLDTLNRSWMLAKGTVVWLATPPKILWQRLTQIRNRPLLPRNCSFRRFQEMYQRRLPFYRSCHLKIESPFSSAKEVANCIAEHYRLTVHHASRAA